MKIFRTARSIAPAARGARVPLSLAQQRLWILAQLGAGAAYHIPVRWKLRGILDREGLRAALDGIVKRQEALRTTFAVVEGVPVQRIASADESAFQLLEQDLRLHEDAPTELERVIAEEAYTAFDFEKGPLIRGRLVRL